MSNDIVETLASGGTFEDVEPIGTNYDTARRQAYSIVSCWNMTMVPVLIKLITKIQEQDKTIEMLEYQTKWRKRRP